MENIFSDMQVGLWSIEIDKDNIPKMYGDKVFLDLLGVNYEILPEDLYLKWYSGIKEEYIGYVNNAIERILSGKQVEVEYIWINNQNQTTFVRCCGKKDDSFNEGIRLKGYHQNIDKIVNIDIKNDENYEVKDYFKLLKYSTFFYELYDECFEIDLETYKIVTIFSRKNKYAFINENSFVFDEKDTHVYPEDREIFNSLFNKERLNKLEENSQSEKIDIRIKNTNNKYSWVRLKALVTTFASRKKLVVYLYDIEDEKKLEEVTREKEDIVSALVDADSAILDIDLENEKVKILKYSKELETNEKIEMTLLELRKRLIADHIQSKDVNELESFFSVDNLRLLAKEKLDKSIEIKMKEKYEEYKWIRISNLSLSGTSNRIFVLMKNINENHLSQNIIEKFVYNNCDYLLYVDLKNNRYIKISGEDKDNTILDREGNNYIEKMQLYIDRYVIPEDRIRMRNIFKTDYIEEALEKKERLDFTTAIIDDNGNYRRKYVVFQYYDRENQIILVQRRDITNTYLSLKEQSDKLEKAEKESITDYLTNIYNRKGCELKIKEYISQKTRDEKSAFLLLDLDNFKKLNDTFGHKVGDEILQKIARILKNNFRISDIVGRLGGDEFVVFMTNIKDKYSLTQKLKKLLKNLEIEYGVRERKIKITASIGAVCIEENDFSFENLYLKADNALYKIKKNGKNSFHIL